MNIEREVTLWPSRENYARFRAVCDDKMPETFDEFETAAAAQQAHFEALHGIKIDRLAFDPDKMALWCRNRFGQVNGEARVAYAMHIAVSI